MCQCCCSYYDIISIAIADIINSSPKRLFNMAAAEDSDYNDGINSSARSNEESNNTKTIIIQPRQWSIISKAKVPYA